MCQIVFLGNRHVDFAGRGLGGYVIVAQSNYSIGWEMVKMKCPFCGYEMQEGKICALGAAMEWKDAGGTDAFRLNSEPAVAARMNGDRIAGYRCAKCKKIIVEYQ